MAAEDGLEGAGPVGLVVVYGVDVLLGQLDRGRVGEKGIDYQQDVGRRGTPVSLLGLCRPAMGGTTRSAFAKHIACHIENSSEIFVRTFLFQLITLYSNLCHTLSSDFGIC